MNFCVLVEVGYQGLMEKAEMIKILAKLTCGSLGISLTGLTVTALDT